MVATDLVAPRRFRKHFRPPEINILARTQDQADVAALLLYAAHALIENCAPTRFTGWDPYTAQAVHRRLSGDGELGQPPFRVQFGAAVDVAGLAVRIARRRSLTDAAFYFLASVYTVSLDPMNLHPKYGDESIARFHNPMHRVWEAQSLFAAFQAIEALDLTVKGARSDKPSIMNGVWEPDIRSDLENRLQRIGVSPADSMSWLRRGSPTAIQRQLETRTSTSSPAAWSSGRVRDETVLYVDAINRAQWLRSNVAAHRSGRRLRGLHTIDALNVQYVARMLIMHAAAFPWWAKRKGSREA